MARAGAHPSPPVPQVLCIERPEQVVEVTLRHLDIMSAMGQAPAVKELLGSARARVLHFQTDKSAGDWLLVRRTICQFLQDKRIKVSLFLQARRHPTS